MSNKLEAALRAARLGLRVIPIKANAKSPPLLSSAFRDATTDEDRIVRLWHRYPDANIGQYCPNHIVLDIDVKPDEDGTPRSGMCQQC